MKTHYEILEVEINVRQDELKQAYRNLARKKHPDIDKSVGAEERFREIVEAYEILSNAEKRAEYDLTISASKPTGSSGVFAKYYEKAESIAGTDIEKEVNLTLEEAMVGKAVKLVFTIKERCEDCEGVGSKKKESVDCLVCNGTGKIVDITENIFGHKSETSYDCSACAEQRKEKEGGTCQSCEGQGFILKTVATRIAIPAGVTDGKVYRKSGLGNHSMSGGNPGDLRIRIVVAEDSRFKTVGNDLHHELSIPAKDFFYGTTLNIDMPNGDITPVEVPAKTQPGTEIRILGKGIKGGNLIVKTLLDFSEWERK